MTLTVLPINPEIQDFAAEVSGVDIAAGVDEPQLQFLQSAIDRYGVLVFRNQRLSDEQQYDFSSLFGPMEEATGDVIARDERRLSMKVNDISNLDKHGNVLSRNDRTRLFGLGNMLWHSDSSFKPIPASYSLLSARVIPDNGGNTEFSDMRAAWDAMDADWQQECLPLVCLHSQIYSRSSLGFEDFTDAEREAWRPVEQPLVREHPNTGRRSLFLSAHIGAIKGLPVPEARMFIRDLTEHATQREYVYRHQWNKWDLVMWDNRVTMHRARRYDHTQPRDLHRTTVSCDSAG